MKNAFFLAVLALVVFGFSNCATIVGGSKYYAKIYVPDHPNATIDYNGQKVGKGEANVKLARKDADKMSITVSESGCKPQTTNFIQRSFRGWAFVGTIVTWTGAVNGIPLPWGVVVDGATGALWKPNVREKGVTKIDHKHYLYRIDYSGCAIEPEGQKKDQIVRQSKAELLRELKQLLEEGLITQDEFDTEKKKVLEGEY